MISISVRGGWMVSMMITMTSSYACGQPDLQGRESLPTGDKGGGSDPPRNGRGSRQKNYTSTRSLDKQWCDE